MKSRTRLSGFTFTFHFHALEKEMATHSSVLAWKIPGTGEPGGLPSMGSHRVGHDWSDLAAAVLKPELTGILDSTSFSYKQNWGPIKPYSSQSLILCTCSYPIHPHPQTNYRISLLLPHSWKTWTALIISIQSIKRISCFRFFDDKTQIVMGDGERRYRTSFFPKASWRGLFNCSLFY